MTILKIKLDKWMHFFAGATISVCAGAIGFYFGVVGFNLFAVAFLPAMFIGAGKEICDSFYPENHTVEFMDFAATAIGGFCIGLVAFAL